MHSSVLFYWDYYWYFRYHHARVNVLFHASHVWKLGFVAPWHQQKLNSTEICQVHKLTLDIHDLRNTFITWSYVRKINMALLKLNLSIMIFIKLCQYSYHLLLWTPDNVILVQSHIDNFTWSRLLVVLYRSKSVFHLIVLICQIFKRISRFIYANYDTCVVELRSCI